jgi:hypothetical protein
MASSPETTDDTLAADLVATMLDATGNPKAAALIRRQAAEIAALRAQLRRAHEWDEYHPAYIAGRKAAAYRRANPYDGPESCRQNG